MNNITDNIDRLLEKTCYVIDFLPERVPEESDGQYFDVDYYLLNSSRYVILKDRCVNVILKLMCYYHTRILWDEWIDKLKGKGGKIDGLDCHTIEFYYSMKIQDKDLSLCKSKTDSGEELVWLSLDEIESSKTKPDFLKENIKSIIGAKETIHIIEERDR